uniref:Myelin and lymphocyte protein n=1 Tax=Oncorhynchus tshawytscha TaxID=74940 RepID=A0AAZ3R8T9_ONCTS
MASSTSSNPLSSGTSVFTTVPDLFFIPEFVSTDKSNKCSALSCDWTTGIALYSRNIIYSNALLIYQREIRHLIVQGNIWIFGGLVWTLVASTKVLIANPQGWVMFVSVFCFIFTTLWFLIFISGANKSSIWPTLDVVYHSLAAFFYLSAAVVQAYITISLKSVTSMFFKEYQLDIAAVVMCYVVTLLYALHAIFSTMRWKSSS